MAILNDINGDLKEAMRAREEFRLSSLRMLVAALKNKKIELGNKNELTDDEIVSVLKTELKKRRDSALIYEEGGRPELAEKEKAEIEIINRYLPEQMTEADLEKIAKDLVTSMGEVGPGDFGRVMGAFMAQVKGRADGALVSRVLKKILSA